MAYKLAIAINDPAAFLAMAKDLKPLGNIIIFESMNYRYKFMTRQAGDVMAISYAPPKIFHTTRVDQQGAIAHDITIRSPYDTPLGWADLYRQLSVATRIGQRNAAIAEAHRRVLASSKPTTMRWKSSNPRITNLRVIIQNVGVQPTICIRYTDVHIRELTQSLERVGFKVVQGHISRE